jgi:hypothetical protein
MGCETSKLDREELPSNGRLIFRDVIEASEDNAACSARAANAERRAEAKVQDNKKVEEKVDVSVCSMGDEGTFHVTVAADALVFQVKTAISEVYSVHYHLHLLHRCALL